MKLQIKCEDVSILIEIKDRITILRGDSGNCKSLLVSKLFNVTDDFVERICDLDYAQLPMSALSLVETSKNVLFIVDDQLLFKSSKVRKRFQNLITNYAVVNNLYFLIIERSVVELKELSYSVHSVLEMKEISKELYVAEEMYKYLGDTGLASEVITEDKTEGYNFANKIFDTVNVRFSGNGKSDFGKANIGKPKFTALVDMYAFGCHIYEFADRSVQDGRRLFYNFGSLEAILWQLYGKDLCYDNSVLLREVFYEEKLASLPDTYKLKCVHGIQHSNCLRLNCKDCIEYQRGNCNQEYSPSSLIRKLKDIGYNNLTVYSKYSKVPNFKDLTSVCEWCIQHSTDISLGRDSYIYQVITFINSKSLVVEYKSKYFIQATVSSEEVKFSLILENILNIDMVVIKL